MHTGLPWRLESWPGLIAAAFDQIAILAFNHWVEKPHFQALMQRSRLST